MKRVLLAGCVALLATGAFAQVKISKSAGGKSTIAFASFRASGDAKAKEFLSTLKADLNRSGYFAVAPSNGEFNVSGSSKSGGGQVAVEIHVFKAGTRQRIVGKSYQSATAQVREMAHKVADEILLAATGMRGMAQAKIAVVSNRTGKKELYRCDMDGQNMRQVTNDKSIVVGPRWTSKGSQLVFTSYVRGYPNIYLADLSSGRRQRLAGYGGLNASGALSPDGRSLAMILSIDGNPDLYLKDLRSGKLRRLTRTNRANEASPCWSPDGSQIAYVSDSSGRPQIYLVSAAGGSPRRLTSTGTENVDPDWGSNGIVFSTRLNGRYQIAVANPKEGTLQILKTDRADYEEPSWAPDGRHIVCSRTSNYRSAIYLLDTLKDSPVALLSGADDWFSPACSR